MATSYEGTLRVNVIIRLNRGLTRGIVGARATINSMQIEERSHLGGTCRSVQAVLGESIEKMEYGAEAQSFPLTEIKDMNSHRDKSGIMLFHGFFILIEHTHLVTQLVDVKLRSKGLSTGQEDVEAGTLEEYAIVLSFELSLRKCDWRVGDCSSVNIRLRESDKSEDKAEGVEVGGRKGQGSDDESRGAWLSKSKVPVRKEIDSEECHIAAKVDLPFAKKRMQM
ncbi:hypothetical protein BHM03_00018038 [Ensete ventricosum]|nr:hypothetical protein BHM03_00018038 [Ensete ventricosum]